MNVLPLLLLAACSGSATSDSAVPEAPDYATDIQPIFDARCAFSGCHGGEVPAQDLDLTAGASYDALVGVPAVQHPELLRVDPGDAETSYLVQKIEGTADYGNPMPPAADGVTGEEEARIRAWIDAGALR